MDEKLVAELDSLKKGLEGKTQAEVKAAMEAFEVSVKENIENETKAVKDAFEVELKGIKEAIEGFAGADAVKEMQDHLDKLDIKMQSKQVEKKEKVSFETGIKSIVAENFDAISKVRKGNSAKLEVKTVGNMTLSNITGDQPRDYSNNVATVPFQLVNFVDMIGAPINISGGTYTFPREGAGEGSIATQTEGSSKSQRDYDLTMVDVNTDFLAGYAVYSKKMANNLPFLESYLPTALRRDYLKAENSLFATTLASAATASAQYIDDQNKVEMLIAEIATLEGIDFATNGIVVRPADWYDIAITEKSQGASGYGLPGIVNISNGMLTINGIPVYKANWIPANKYFVGDWSTVKKVVTEGLSLEFSNEDSDNFRKNNITARIEAQIGLAIERTDAIIYGDFTAADPS